LVLDMMEVDMLEACERRFDEIQKGLLLSIFNKSILTRDVYVADIIFDTNSFIHLLSKQQVFKKHIKNILQGELDNKEVHLLLPMIKKEIKATIKHVACTYLKLVHHNIVSRYSSCNTKSVPNACYF